MKEETAGSDFLYPSEMVQNTFLLDYLGGKTDSKSLNFTVNADSVRTDIRLRPSKSLPERGCNIVQARFKFCALSNTLRMSADGTGSRQIKWHRGLPQKICAGLIRRCDTSHQLDVGVSNCQGSAGTHISVGTGNGVCVEPRATLCVWAPAVDVSAEICPELLPTA